MRFFQFSARKPLNLFLHYAALLTVFVVFGCSTANKEMMPPEISYLPPEASGWPLTHTLLRAKDIKAAEDYLNRIEQENGNAKSENKLSLKWWIDYKRAQLWTKSNPKQACAKYTELAAEPQFPIRRVAFIRAQALCEPNLLTESLDLSKMEPWLVPSALDVAIEKAERTKDSKNLMALYLRKSKLNIKKDDKVDLTQKALDIANRLGLADSQKELKQRLYNLAPSYNPKPDAKDALLVAGDFKYYRKFDSARSHYWAVIKNKNSAFNDKVAAYRGIRLTHRIQLDREESIKVTEQLVKYVDTYFKKWKKKDLKAIADVNLLLARDYWTEQKNEPAERILEKLLRLLPAGPSLAETLWMLGRMAEEKQDFATAVVQYEKALSQPAITKGFGSRLKWYYAWNLRKQKDYKKAAEVLASLQDSTDNAFDKSRYTFWLAVSQRENGENDRAEETFNALIRDEPLNFYGLLAHREMKKDLPVLALKRDVGAEETRVKLTSNLRKIVDENFIEWLIAVKENDLAKDYLADASDQLKKKRSDDLEDWTILFKYYARANQYLQLFSQAGNLSADSRKRLFEKNPELVFPRPYYETVSQAATRFGISAEFIYSIMRQESSFNPHARSQMDAFGLMQLLPEVAKRSAETHSIEYESPEDLYEPQVNIPIGSAHLKELWDRYNGEVILAAASYNASEKAIVGWMSTRYRGDTMEFIEDIPYDETRDYVKLVLRNLITYQMLNTNGDSLAFPDWTMRISAREASK